MIRFQIEADLIALKKRKKEPAVPIKNTKGETLGPIEAKLVIKHQIQKLETLLKSSFIPDTYIPFIATPHKMLLRTDAEALRSTLSPGIFSKFALKQSRKTSKDQPLSAFYTYQDDPARQESSFIEQFTLEHREDKLYPNGTCADRVKKGFISGQTEPRYAVKIFKPHLNNDNNHALRMGMRASCCARLLGRTGFTFKSNHKQYFVTDWHSGRSLAEIPAEELTKIDINLRIKWALDLIREVVILHRKKFIHCDIKPSNCMISDNHGYLIDFDSVRLEKELPFLAPLIHTEECLDPQLNYDLKYNKKVYKQFNEQSDLYALGITLIFLFPEVLKSHNLYKQFPIEGTDAPHTCKVIKHTKGPLYNQHKKLADILLSITHLNRANRAILTSASLFEKLVSLYQEDYKQTYTLKANQLEATFEQSGEALFERIEVEILEFEHRESLWRPHALPRNTHAHEALELKLPPTPSASPEKKKTKKGPSA